MRRLRPGVLVFRPQPVHHDAIPVVVRREIPKHFENLSLVARAFLGHPLYSINQVVALHEQEALEVNVLPVFVVISYPLGVLRVR